MTVTKNRTLRRSLFLFGSLTLSGFAMAQGGPPMITDDPATPGNRHWEINFAYTTERSRGEVHSETPLVDINYGLGDFIQLKVEFPWLASNVAGDGRKQGLGDTNFGVKWRFIDRGERKLQVSTYPQFTFNTIKKSIRDGLVDGDADIFLPIEATQSFGALDVNVEAGFDFAEHRDNSFDYGIVLGHEFEKYELAVELHSSIDLKSHELDRLALIGTRYHLSPNRTLMASYGVGIGHRAEGSPWTGYVGLQFTF